MISHFILLVFFSSSFCLHLDKFRSDRYVACSTFNFSFYMEQRLRTLIMTICFLFLMSWTLTQMIAVGVLANDVIKVHLPSSLLVPKVTKYKKVRLKEITNSCANGQFLSKSNYDWECRPTKVVQIPIKQKKLIFVSFKFKFNANFQIKLVIRKWI